jgi:general stress protein 26
MQMRTLLTAAKAKSLSERQKRIHDFLQSQRIGVLSTVTPNGDPHGAVVYYVLGDDFTIWFLTKKGTRKSDNLLHNNHLMLTVCDFASQTTAQILGTAVEHPETAAINEISGQVFMRMMEEGNGQLPPIMKLQAGAFTTFAIKPVQIRMAVYSRPEVGEGEQLFESIESFSLNEA